MTDWVGHAPKNHMTSLEQWERELKETVPHVSDHFYVDTQLLCHKRFIWLHPHFMVQADDHESILLPQPGPRDHLPLTLDLVTNGLRHCPDPTRGRRDHEQIEEMLSDPVARLTFFKEVETKIRNSSIVGRAATEATPDDAWENLVQIIQETAGPHFHQGAPRPTRSLAMERRRFQLELGTARRLTNSSINQSLVEKAKTEVTRVEKQMRRFSRWLLRRRRAMWREELEEGIRKQDAFTVYRYARLVAGTGTFWTNSSLHPFSDEMGTRSGKRMAQGKSCSTRIHVDRLQTRAFGACGLW